MTIRDVVEIKLFRRWTSYALSGAKAQARSLAPKCSEMERGHAVLESGRFPSLITRGIALVLVIVH